ncbi:fungal-specific transcription factor domain-containing protein [Aspergillus pseudoustus]|uniref:Fungal-specific transcription factor domain-containing protein n=1 Tax=Aspergillus pseudoustus TaxID=1810923 RepID=A0ABR4ID61_9EURO
MENTAEQAVNTQRLPRRFKIRSSFGQARQARSRKNRPCDACRRRKTACVINVEPPCVFCRSRGLPCRALTEPKTPSRAGVPHTRTGAPEAVHSAASESASPSLSQDPVPAAVVHDGFVHPSSEPRTGSHPPGEPPAENVQSLEDTPARTAHSMGLASEQDPHFLSLFGSVLLSEQDEIDAKYVQVHPGGSGSDPDHHPPIHFLLLEDGFPAHTNQAMQEASDAIEALVSPHGPALVRLYFRHVHPAFAVVSKGRFLRQYHEDKKRLPASLRSAVYALACVFWARDETLPKPRPFEQHQLTDHAHASLRRELEAPNLYKLQACLLLMHIVPPDIDSVETPSLWMLAAQATACAQMIGLHQDPTEWCIPAWEKKLRKKLWWAVYVIDCWSAVCHGNPAHIATGTFNTRPPDMEDLRFDEDIPAELLYLVDDRDTAFRIPDGARFLEMVHIARDMRAVLDCSCQIGSTAQTRDSLVDVYDRLKEWRNLVPSCLAAEPFINNGSVHLSYYATQALLFRGLMYPVIRGSAATANSNFVQWLPKALDEFEAFTFFMETLTNDDLAGFWIRHSRSQLILCGNFLIYLFLLATEPRDIEAAYGLLESLHNSLQRLGDTKHLAARLLLRPTMLRINSFFAQATELITHARSVVRGSPTMLSA